ncbi:MAG TPA: hypothetical protein VI685_17350 [Candidatus Angelobacter sp.]
MHTFPGIYDFHLNPELPGERQAAEIYFPNDLRLRGKVGLKVEFTLAKGATWVGVFAEGYESTDVITGVFPTPNDHFACVIAQGRGYLIDVMRPEEWKSISVFPVTSIAASESEHCLILTNHTNLAVLSEDGASWTTDRLASDELHIVGLVGHVVQLEGWIAEENRRCPVAFDLRSRRAMQ